MIMGHFLMLDSVKKQRLLQILLLTVLGSLLLALGLQEAVKPPVFSHESGFYEDAFCLELFAAPGTTIHYTLDGSLPDESSAVYTEPLLIRDATPNENTISMRTDISVGFYPELLEKYQSESPDPGYRVPDFPVDKCTVIRAVAVGPSGAVSEAVSATYFAQVSPEAFGGCRILSLITDPENLFDSETGIYVTGQYFEDYLENEVWPHWEFWDANYLQRGREWERPVELDLFDSQGRLFLSKAAGVRVHGRASRAMLPRGLNIYARVEYDRTESFGIPLFETDYIPSAVVLSSGGNEVMTQFPDYMMTHMVRDLNIATMLQEPYVMFLNGEYWGFYWMTEKYDEQYLAQYYHVQADNVVMVKSGELEAGKEKDMALYETMQTFLTETDLSAEENYRRACDMIDMESFLDYYATMIYIARCQDWPMDNFALWRVRDPSLGGTYGDGKWRWMLFDCNSTAMQDYSGLTQQDTLAYVIEKDPVFRSLWANASFRDAFAERILLIGRTCFTPEKMDAFIQRYVEDMMPALQKSWDRFYGSGKEKQKAFLWRMDDYSQFFRKRYAVVESWFA